MNTTRSQSKSMQNAQQNISTPSTNEPLVSINWLVFNSAREATVPRSIDIPLSLFQKRSQDCCSLFDRALRHEFEGDIIFWKPKELLLVQTAQREDWAGSIRDIFDSFQLVSMMESFAEALNTNDEDAVHLVVTVKSIHPGSTAVTEHREPSYPMYDGLQAMVENPGQAPSDAAKISNYFNIQATENQALYDGRYPVYSQDYQSPVKRVVTVAPPIQIYHPIFHKFLQYISDPSVQPSHELLEATLSLMKRLSGIDKAEGERNWDINESLSQILGFQIMGQAIPDGSRADGAYFMFVNDIRIPIFVMELEREIGAGECDPSTQAGFFMRRSWIDGRRSVIRDKCCCPGFIIAGAGSWMGVLGSVMTDKFITQRLTNLQWCGLSSTSEDARIYRFARVLNALRLCVSELEEYYTDIGAAMDIKLPPHDPHPRYFPYPHSFTDEDNKIIRFEYLRALEEREPTCTTFLAEAAGKKIVVKFVPRYGSDAHKFLAAEGHAPRLHYHGPLPDTKAITTTLKYPGLSLGPLQMVVMDYVVACGTIPSNARQQLEVILEKLHVEGYVFGDFRLQNIIFDEEKNAKLIDFDWAGRFDMSIPDNSLPESLRERIQATWERKEDKLSGEYAYYPLNISMEVAWAPGVDALEPILPSHDLDMFARLEL